MSPVRRFSLSEYGTIHAIELSQAQIRSLSGIKAITATASGAGRGLFDLTANHTVGLIGLPEIEIEIVPKVGVTRLLFLIAYAMGIEDWNEDHVSVGDADSLPLAVANAFTSFAERAIAQGVLQGYRTEEDSLPVLRGRLLAGAQVSRRYGQVLPLEVRFDDFSIDIAENQLLRSAAIRLLAMEAVTGSTRRRLRRLVRKLEGTSTLVPGVTLPATPIDRRNARYAGALALARLVLDAASIEIGDANTEATGLTFNMNTVFENFMVRALQPSFLEGGGTLVHHYVSSLDLHGRVSLEPDLTWVFQGKPRAVMDLKYKSIADKQIPNPDAYQMLAYSLGLGLSSGHLIYAAGSAEPTTHVIKATGTTITVWAIDLEVSVNDLFSVISALATSIRETEAKGIV